MSTEQRPDWLKDWCELSEESDWDTLLVGNGCSLAVWPEFRYESLFDIAQKLGDDGLNEQDTEIFDGLSTRNFERVLLALRDASLVNKALGLDTEPVLESYSAIRKALGAAVSKVHVPRNDVNEETLRALFNCVTRYKHVFSTNYDLLIYWALFSEREKPPHVKDFFWSRIDDSWRVFDPANADVWNQNVTRVLYLHGGLHLYHHPDGRTAKYVRGRSESLLDAFRRFMSASGTDEPVPLLVSEGTADDKRAAIASSDYLSFAFNQLGSCEGPLVIFGHSLGDSDRHIAETLNSKRSRRIAVSIRSSSPDELKAKRAHYEKVLPRAKLLFFEASTHPLGSPELLVGGKEGQS